MTRFAAQPPPLPGTEPNVRWRRVGRAVGIGLGVGLLVAVASGWGLWAWQLDRESSDRAALARQWEATDLRKIDVPPPGEEIRELLAQEGRVVVSSSVAEEIPEADRARAEQLLSDSGRPLRLAFMRSPESSAAGYTEAGAVATWAQQVGEDGHYVVIWSGGRSSTYSLGLEEQRLDEEPAGRPGPALVRTAEAMTEFSDDRLGSRDAAEERDRYDEWDPFDVAFRFIALGVLPLYLVLLKLLSLRPERADRSSGRELGT